MKPYFLFFFLILSGFLSQAIEAIESLPVQDGGRVKPFFTFAKESLTVIYGKRVFKNQKASYIVFTWPLFPEVWKKEKIIRIQSAQVKKSLRLRNEEVLFSLEDLLQNPHFKDNMKRLETLRTQNETLKSLDKELAHLEYQVGLFYQSLIGERLKIAPSQKNFLEGKWLSLKELSSKGNKASKLFIEIITSFSRHLKSKEGSDLEERISNFQKGVGTSIYNTKMKVEVFFHKLRPFFFAFLLYVLGSLLLVFQLSWGKAILFIGFLFHTIGFLFRIYISSRAPVTNMYETVIWVPWGAMLIGFFLSFFKKEDSYMKASGIVGTFCLLVSMIAPSILDPSLQPLEPVLRDNFWLTTHVLSITLSYGAFALAWLLANIALTGHFFQLQKYKSLNRSSRQVYEVLKIGVVLLALGVFLGGVWADYSWGRFWGWDPKETWALISLLAYLALLHGRLSGWLSPLAVLISSIVGFCLIIMTWYGVNFVLGQGLHSYGFGSGGSNKVGFAILLQFLWLFYIFRKSTFFRKKSS